MAHRIQLLDNGWTLEFLADDSDKFKVMLTSFAGKIKKTIDDYMRGVPLKIVRKMGDYVKREIDSYLEEYLQKITTGEDLTGCVFQKYVKEGTHPRYDRIRAEIRFEESRHNDEIEVEGIVFKNPDEEKQEGSIVLFREREFKRRITPEEKEDLLKFKARVGAYSIDLMRIINTRYFPS